MDSTQGINKALRIRVVAKSGTDALNFDQITQLTWQSDYKSGELEKKKKQKHRARNGVTCAKLHISKTRLNT